MKKWLNFIVILFVLFIANNLIINVLPDEKMHAFFLELNLKEVMGEEWINILKLCISSFLSVLEEIVLMFIRRSDEKKNNKISPYLRISANVLSVHHRNDTIKNIPKIKINYKENAEFTYVFADVINSGQKAISQLIINKTSVLDKDLYPKNKVPIVFCVYQHCKKMKISGWLIKLKYKDEEERKYWGVSFLILDTTHMKASIATIIKQRRV